MSRRPRAALRFGPLVLLALLAAPLARPAAPGGVAHPSLWPWAASPPAITDAATEARIDRLLDRMTLEEKVGQTIQAGIGAITPDDLRRYPLGALLAGGNDGPGGDNRAGPAQWLALIRAFKAVAAERRANHEPIPLIFGVDAVHGHNKIKGATLFPHNIGLGAARDPELVEQIGAATADEVAATGVDWTFAPTLAVPRDVRWGRSYEGYAEEPEVVASYAGPMTLGLQGPLIAGRPLAAGHVVGSAKHFLADGGTAGGQDQGDASIPEPDLIALHAQGYPAAIDAGVLTVMASFSSWNGVKITGDASLLTGVLKGRLGFNGFVVGDWNAHGQIPGCTVTDCPAAMNAGLDMYMAPDSWKGLFDNTLAQARSGGIPMARLDDAVRRILRVKIKAGLFEGPRPTEGQFERLGAPAHRAIARRAVRESLVLLKNDTGVLPVRASARILVAGDAADDIGRQAGGWTLNWQGQGNANADFPHGQSILGGIAEAVRAGGGEVEFSPDGDFRHRPDVAIVVFGETPYAEFQGDVPSLEFEPGDKRALALLDALKSRGVPVVSVFLSGRPLWVNPEINASDAFVAAWLPGAEGGGVADVLIGDSSGAPRFEFRGRLPSSWPRRVDRPSGHRGDPGYDPQFPYGYGLSYAHATPVGRLSEDPGQRAASVNVDRYFVAGHTPAPWSLELSGAVTARAIDAGAQENGRRIDWSGGGTGVLAISGPPADLSRQALGDMALLLRYRVDAAPTAPVRLEAVCGAGCAGGVDVTALLSPARDGSWRTWKIKLSCLRDAGADMRRITSPLTLATRGRLALEFTEARLAVNEGDAICPAATGTGYPARPIGAEASRTSGPLSAR
jgi:beta-glucosidase